MVGFPWQLAFSQVLFQLFYLVKTPPSSSMFIIRYCTSSTVDHADMAVPALARFGTDELKKEFLVPTIAGDVVACLGVSEVGGGSDVASIKTTAVPKKGIWMVCLHRRWSLSTDRLQELMFVTDDFMGCRF